VQIVSQQLEDILGSLQHLEVDWKDETAIHVIAQLQDMAVKATYSVEDVEALLDVTWRERKSDMRKLVDLQNNGDIMRIYTYAMADQFEKDLRQLKSEGGL
jgi:accessory colonization factor AcfC